MRGACWQEQFSKKFQKAEMSAGSFDCQAEHRVPPAWKSTNVAQSGFSDQTQSLLARSILPLLSLTIFPPSSISFQPVE